MGHFDPIPGNGATSAAAQFGALAGDVKGDIDKVLSGMKTAQKSWQAPRAEEFATAVFGIQAELALVNNAAKRVSQLLTEFSTTFTSANHDMDGLRAAAAKVQQRIDHGTSSPADLITLSCLREDADRLRKKVKDKGVSIAAEVDGYVNVLVPGASSLTPEQIRTKVNGATGVTTHGPGATKNPWDLMAAATRQGQRVQKLQRDNLKGERVGGPVTALPTDPDVLKDLVDSARMAGLQPQLYGAVLHQYWAAKAAREAGIDLDAWDPQKGVDANQANITKVYEYYGKLFLKDPSKFQWAGMANMIGPSFAGGFMDLDMMKDLAKKMQDKINELPEWARGAVPPEIRGLASLADLGGDELGWYEKKFLGMQKNIFFDQGAMHQAYVEGGTREIDDFYAAGLIDKRAQQAWSDINSGDPVRVKQGNTDLLWREQNQIINEQYDQMRSYHPPVGDAVTYGMTVLGDASIPGTKTPGEWSSISFQAKSSHKVGPVSETLSINASTPLPDFNIADREDRWRYVSGDTLPAYQKLLETDPERAKQIIGSSVDQRIDEQRLANRWPRLAQDLTSNWHLNVTSETTAGPIRIPITIGF